MASVLFSQRFRNLCLVPKTGLEPACLSALRPEHSASTNKVVKGMDVADKISQVPTHDVGPYQNVPSKPVVILSAKVLP